jgi:hypothetical protein
MALLSIRCENAIADDKTPDDNERKPLVQRPLGATAGGVVGAAAAAAVAGGIAGPAGAIAGAVIGAATGALTGRAFAGLIDPETEVAFWRDQWHERPAGAAPGLSYEQDFSPAYRYGVDAFAADPERHFDELEPQLAAGWHGARGASRLDWSDARLAALDAWQRARDLAQRGPG